MNDFLWKVKAKLYRLMRSCFPFNLVVKSENKRLEWILQSVEITGKKVVDLGTGTGNVLQFLTHANPVLAIDITFTMLQAARQLYPNSKFIQADALNLPLKTNAVDVIIAIGLSEYVSNIDSLFKEISRLLKIGSFLILTFSPGGIWSRVRLLLGHSIYPRTLDDLLKVASEEQFQLVKNSRSMMQGQVLFQKVN